LQNANKRKKVDFKKTRKFTKENICHLAIKNGHVSVLCKIVEHFDVMKIFKDPEYMDYAGNTPLHSMMMNVVSEA
jgi:hypothetical protein